MKTHAPLRYGEYYVTGGAIRYQYDFCKLSRIYT